MSALFLSRLGPTKAEKRDIINQKKKEKGGILVTVREALDRIDATFVNNIGDAMKISWIKDVEGRVLCEIFKKSPNELASVLSEDDVLSVPEAYCTVYMLYVASMIEFSKGNYDAYAKLCARFEKDFELYARWYIRNLKK